MKRLSQKSGLSFLPINLFPSSFFNPKPPKRGLKPRTEQIFAIFQLTLIG
jgi:hypothetical protein